MSGLIVIDVVIFGVLIMIATVIVVSRGRRSSGRAARRRGAAAEPRGVGRTPREAPITPGLRAETAEPDPGADRLAEREQPEPEQAEPERAATELAEPGRPEPERPEPEQAELEPTQPLPAISERAASEQAAPAAAPAKASEEVAAHDPGRNGSAVEPDRHAEPDRHHDATRAATGVGQIGNYYEGADQPIADYLAERGWPQEPGRHDPADRA